MSLAVPSRQPTGSNLAPRPGVDCSLIPFSSTCGCALLCVQGGDEPEAQLIAIQNMANETYGLSWRANAVKVMVLTTDAPFHTGNAQTPGQYSKRVGGCLAARFQSIPNAEGNLYMFTGTVTVTRFRT